MEQIIQQMVQETTAIEEQIHTDLLMSTILADFMQKHVSSKYFMLNMEYADRIMNFN